MRNRDRVQKTWNVEAYLQLADLVAPSLILGTEPTDQSLGQPQSGKAGSRLSLHLDNGTREEEGGRGQKGGRRGGRWCGGGEGEMMPLCVCVYLSPFSCNPLHMVLLFCVKDRKSVTVCDGVVPWPSPRWPRRTSPADRPACAPPRDTQRDTKE